MDAPEPVLWVLCGVLIVVGVPCVVRLAMAHPASELRGVVNRADDAAELLMCVGMLAMASPVGGPIPLAGWRAVFGVAVLWLAVSWLHATLRGSAAVCGHHVVSAAVMLYMLAGPVSHGADPWLRMTDHTDTLPLTALVVVAVGYHLADVTVSGVRTLRSPPGQAATPRAFRPRTRHLARAAMSGSMAFMLLSMA